MRSPHEIVLDEHLAAENAHDLERIVATYAASPLVILNGHAIRGRDEIREFHRAFGFGGDEGSFTSVAIAERHRHHAAEGAIIVEQTLSGLHTGRWQDLEPTGRAFEVLVCTVYSFADGLLASERVYFDQASLRRQLTRPEP